MTIETQIETIPTTEDPPRSPRDILPTMDDLPSEDPEEPGLPDEFHFYQPDLLRRTCRSPRYSPESTFVGVDINFYYDVRHHLRYKRPDWFLVVGVPRLWEETRLRNSYVMWQEGVAPLVVVELLSPGTGKEDLGETENPAEDADRAIPSKWEVYEQILRVPYCLVYDRRTQRLRFFQLEGARYRERSLNPQPPLIWIPELELGLDLRSEEYEGIPGLWLRWCDDRGNPIPTDTEAERQRAEAERQRADRLAARLRELGVDLEEDSG
ncbi:MAG TPA: Uma2 family endonuclease [Oscillatoriales cyanobacterium M59_W2019_021]|nr:Uma2 family endonuclease [Oscillatoriales cyanobacterium M4454_W2019_049]HIK52303.1 Uma2 family endonuclease [Oscillatoriales cyanobacterium M59_W2019_021]